MKIKLFIILIIVSLFLIGCPKKNNTITVVSDLKTIEDIQEVKKTIKESEKSIKKTSKEVIKKTETINIETDKAQSKLPEDIKPEIDPHLNTIKETSTDIAKNMEEIDKTTDKLTSATSILERTEKKVTITEGILDKIVIERDKAIKAKKEAEEKAASALNRAIRWLILGSMVGAGAFGVLALMYNSKVGLTLAAICIVTMSIAIFVQTYFIYLVIGGGIILLSLIGLLIYNIIIQKRAFKEVIETTELVKINLPQNKKEAIFGKKNKNGELEEPGEVSKIQSKKTSIEVKKVKNKISNLWTYIKNKKVE